MTRDFLRPEAGEVIRVDLAVAPGISREGTGLGHCANPLSQLTTSALQVVRVTPTPMRRSI